MDSPPEKSPMTDSLRTSDDRVTIEQVGSSVGYDDKSTRRLLRRVDIALIPFLALLYL